MRMIFILSLILSLTGCAGGPNPTKSKGNPLDSRPYLLIYQLESDSGDSKLWVHDLELDSSWKLMSTSSREARPVHWNDSILSYFKEESGQWKRKAYNLRDKSESELLPGIINESVIVCAPNQLMIAGDASEGDSTHVFIARADGKRFQWLTKNHGGGKNPQWSPDGLTLLYESNRDGNPELYLFQLTTAYERRLTHSPQIDGNAVWHPNGEKIAFTSSRHRPEKDLYLINLADGKVKRLTNNSMVKGTLKFSPNGQLLAYSAKNNQDQSKLFMYNLKSDSSYAVIINEENARYPNWILKEIK